MDPISITAGVVGVTVACLKLAKVMKRLRPKYLEASATIAAICSESTLVSASLSQIQTLLLQKSKEITAQLQTRPELAATFDTTLTGCRIVFACLEEEVTRLEIEAWKGEDLDDWTTRAKIAWKAEAMKELLQSIRGQQGAISLLIQMLQMDSLSGIQQMVQDNTAMLRGVVQRTRSLRHSNPRVSASVPESILGRGDSESFLHVDDASTIGATEFDFDDIVINSKAYRRALESLQKRKSNTTDHPISDSEFQREIGDHAEKVQCAPRSGVRVSVPESTSWEPEDHQLSPTTLCTESKPTPLVSHVQPLRKTSHIRRKPVSSSRTGSLSSITNHEDIFWTSIPDLKLNENLCFPPLRPSSLDSDASSIRTNTTRSSTNTDAESEGNSSPSSSATSCSTESSFEDSQALKQPPLTLADFSDRQCPSKLSSLLEGTSTHLQPHAVEQKYQSSKNPQDATSTKPSVLFEANRHTSASHLSTGKPLIHWAGKKTAFSGPSALKQDQDAAPQPTTPLKPALKKKSVSFQLPIKDPSSKSVYAEEDERLANQHRFQRERNELEGRRREWESRRRRAPSIDQALSPPMPPRRGVHSRTRSEELIYSFPPHLPMAMRGDNRMGLSKPAPLRGADLPPPQLAQAAIVRAAQSVYALNARAYMPPRQSYQRPWKPASQMR